MLKKKLSGILAVVMAASAFSTAGFAQTEETKLFSDNFENGLSSDMWNVVSNSGLGEVKSDQVRYVKTSNTENAEFSCEYSAEKEDVSFNAVINAAEWKSEGEAFEAYVRYVDEGNYFKLTYTPSSGIFTLFKCVGGTETQITTAEKQLAADTDYKISLQAKHGVVRFELDGITLIQDYTGIDNFNKEAASNYAKFKTLSQELKITNLNISEEDTLLHQKFANTGWIMTDSDEHNDSNGIRFTNGAYIPQADSLLIIGAQEARIQQNEWEYSNKGTDFARTEAIFVMRIDSGPDDTDVSGGGMGLENLHFRTCVNANNAAMYLAKIWRDGYSLGDNYGHNGHNEAVKKDGYGHNYGFRPYAADGKYHTYRVVTEPNSDFSKVTMTLYIDGDEHLKWEDDAPVRYDPEEWPDRILAGGFELATTQSVTKISLKSYELRDITATDDVIYTENFSDTSKWTGSFETVTVGESDNKYYVTTANDNGTLVVSDKSWKNIVAETDVKFDALPENASLDNYAGVMARYADANNYIMGAYSPYAATEGKGTVFVKSVVNGSETITAKKEVTAFAEGSIHKLGINVKDGAAIIFVDGEAVLNAPFAVTNAQLYGSVALKSNNIATKFDNVSISGTPYYFIEEFKETPDWSNYKVGNTSSSFNENVVLKEDGTLELNMGSQLVLAANNSNAAWDDVEMTVRMKTPSGTLNGVYLRGGRTSDNWNYCVAIGSSDVSLRTSAYWKLITSESGCVTVAQNEWVDVKMRLTDVDTNSDGEADAVRVRLTVDGKTYLDYINNSSIEGATEGGSYPLLSKDYGRGFKINTDIDRTYVIDSITITDPEAGTLIASVSAPETFSANSDVETKLTVDNKGYEAAETMFITALYNDADELIDVIVTYPTTASDAKQEYTKTINTGSAAKLKVFAWDGWNTMIPVAEQAISNVTAQQVE